MPGGRVLSRPRGHPSGWTRTAFPPHSIFRANHHHAIVSVPHMGTQEQEILNGTNLGQMRGFITAPQTRGAPALDRALTVLELLGQSKVGLSLPQLVERTRLPKSSLHCLLITLERRGYLRRNGRTGRHQLGLKFLALAKAALSGNPIRELAATHLKWLSEATGLTAHLAIMENDEVVLISKHSAPGVFRLATWIGKRMDIHCTGLGKAMIAYLPQDEIERIISEHGMPRHNDQTLCSFKKLRADLALTTSRGYALDYEEDEVGMCCVGAPIFDLQGRPISAVSISGTTEQIAPKVEQIAQQVKRTAEKIGEQVVGHLTFTI